MRFAILNKSEALLKPAGYRVKTKADGRFKRWAANTLWSLLHRLNAVEQYQFTETFYSFSKPAQDSIFSMVSDQMLQVVAYGEDLNNYALVVGAETFEELTQATMHRHAAVKLEGPYPFGLPGGYRGAFRNVPVHVVPLMEGVALIPKVVIECEKIAVKREK